MKTKLLTYTIFIILTGILIYVILQQFHKTNTEVLELYTEHQTLLSHQASLSLENFISERIKAINVLADFPASRQKEPDIFLLEYERTFKKVSGFEYIMFLDENVIPQYGYPSPFSCPSQQIPDEWQKFLAAFNKAKNEKRTIVHPKNILINDKLYICIISPIFSFTDQFIGAIVGILDVKVCINSAIKPVIEDKDDYAWLINNEGYLIYHPLHENMILNNIFTPKENCLECHYNFDLEKQIIERKILSGVKQNKETEKQLITYTYLPLDPIGWYIIISTPYNKITASIDKLNENIFLIGGIVLFFLVIGSIYLIKIKAREIENSKELENIRMQASLIDEKNAAETQYHLLVEQSNDPIFLCTKDKFLIVNKSFEKLLLKYLDDFSIDKYSPKIINDKILDEITKNKLKAFLLSRKNNLKFDIVINDSVHQNIEFIVSLRRFVLFRNVYYQVIANDFTEMRKLEKEKLQRNNLALLGEMASQISHEIKNPLASIQTGMQLLENRLAKDENQKEYFHRLISEIQRIDGVLKGLLAYAKGDNLTLSATTSQRLIKDFIQIVEPTVAKQQMNLKLKISDGSIPILVDNNKIQQVLWNITLNALQASNTGDSIIIETDQEDNFYLIKIIDNGSGMEPEKINKIFKPFFTTKKHGSGLGLAISKKIMDQHHGNLIIESKVGTGTIVKILIPKHKEHNE